MYVAGLRPCSLGRLFTSCSKLLKKGLVQIWMFVSNYLWPLSSWGGNPKRQADQRLIQTDLSHSWAIHIPCDRTNTPAPCQQHKNHFPKEAFSLDRYINSRRSRVTPSICSSLGTQRYPRAAHRPLRSGRHIPSHGLRPKSCSALIY